MDFGTFTASVSGTGAITVSSGYTLSNGTLDVSLPLFVIQGGANTLTTISNTLTTKINAGGAVRLQSNSGAMTANGAINLNGGNLILFANNATNAVTVNGAINVLVPSTISVQSPANGPVVHNGNLTGSAALAINNTTGDVARVLQLAGNNSGYSGTITFGGTAGRATRLTSATAGARMQPGTFRRGIHCRSLELVLTWVLSPVRDPWHHRLAQRRSTLGPAPLLEFCRTGRVLSG
jgi:hypothetical protein